MDHISYRAKKSGSGREWKGSGRTGGGSEFCQTFLYAPGCRGSTSKRGGGGGGHMFSQILRLQAGRRSAPPSDRSASPHPGPSATASLLMSRAGTGIFSGILRKHRRGAQYRSIARNHI